MPIRVSFICAKKTFRHFVSSIGEFLQLQLGESHIIAQLTHSGRYSKPNGVARPITAVKIPFLFADGKDEYEPVSDEYLKGLIPYFVKAAKLAKKAGFDAVDIKACHRYLISELLGAFSRPGEYGGSFENRTRLLLEIIDAVRAEVEIEVVVRLNIYDAIPFPFGFGVSKEDFHKPDLSEPIRLLNLLYEHGVRFVDLSCGNPYYNPHVGRPYDQGGYLPPSHPLEDDVRMLTLICDMQKTVLKCLSWQPDSAGCGNLAQTWRRDVLKRDGLAWRDSADRHLPTLIFRMIYLKTG